MWKLPYILALICLAFTARLQAQSHTIKGVILDANTHEPLVKATVMLKGTKKGTLSNKEGVFELKTNLQNPVLQITYIGYYPQKQKIEIQNQKPILIQMHARSIQLNEVVITGQIVEVVYPDPLTHIHNYEFAGDNLLLLIQEPGESRQKMILYSPEDSILDVNYGPEPIGSLFLDCLGQVHALSRKSAYQLLEPKQKINLSRESLATFNEVVRPVLGHLDSSLFYRTSIGDHQAMFFRVSANERQNRMFYATKDEKKLLRIEDDKLMAAKGFEMYGWMDPTRSRSQRMAHQVYMKEIGNAPIIVPLKIVGNEVVIFDHANHKLMRFDSQGNAIGEAPIEYHKKRYWQKKVLVDDLRAEIYTVFRKNGRSILKEIDLQTGKLVGEWTIPKQFISKLRVRNGYAWFIYKDSIYDDKKRMFKMQLK